MVTPSQAIRSVDLFSHLSDESLEALVGCLLHRHFPAGAPIVREGDTSFDAYLIVEGRVAIHRETPYGRYTLAHLDNSEVFGETAFVDRLARSTNASADRDTDLVVFPTAALDSLFEADRRLALALHWAFWKSLSRKLRATNTHLTQFFSEAGRVDVAAPAADGPPAAEFHLALADKRKLFEEQRLSALEINFLSSLSQEHKLAPGQAIFREGEAGEEMFVVVEGRVMISKYIAGAGEEALAFLERGDYFGEMALIDRVPRSADATAGDGGAVVLSIPRDVLEGILDIHKVSSLRLLKILCSLVAKRLRELDDKLVGWFILAGGGGAGRV